MSALDQALIKAYDKPTARAPVAAAAPRPAADSSATPAPRSAGTGHANAIAIERLYHEGGLYRIDRTAAGPARDDRAPAANNQPTLAGPHYLLPPPTSPKRGVRRSILRLLAQQQLAAVALPAPESSAPPVRRKVIIRHVAHGSPVPSHHLMPLRAAETLAPAAEDAAIETAAALAELQDIAPPIEVHGHWEAPLPATANLVVLQDSADPRWANEAALVHVQFEEFPDQGAAAAIGAIEQSDEATADLGTIETPAAAFVAKSLDDDREAKIRADHGHPRGPHRPHIHFGAGKNEQESTAASYADVEPALVDDVILGPLPAAQPGTAAVPADTANRPIPVWEVDRFHWPRNCEKLLADERGYLAGAGEKLAAAVADGLKTLAITGSRRGEGRTTLALCLARVAARAGIQVALVDGDFTRPTLATRLGLDVAHGWQKAALGQIPLSEAAIRSLADNITVLPLEVSAAGRSLTLADPRVTATLRAAAATFELVIVDLGPLGPGERLTFPPGEATPLDAMIVVRDLRYASAAECQDVGERLHDAGIEAVGVAENFVDEEKAPGRST